MLLCISAFLKTENLSPLTLSNQLGKVHSTCSIDQWEKDFKKMRDFLNLICSYQISTESGAMSQLVKCRESEFMPPATV